MRVRLEVRTKPRVHALAGNNREIPGCPVFVDVN